MKSIHPFTLKKSLVFIALIAFPLLSTAHDGHHTKPAWDACKEKVKHDTCSYIMQENKLYAGTCLVISDDLMCIRNQPIKSINK